jgi:hypothetical protein
MPTNRWLILLSVSALTVLAPATTPTVLRGDTVVMKNGTIYRGTVDNDNTIVFIFDGLKRVVVRDSKIARRQSDGSLRNMETFRLEQPLVVHTGIMPKEVVRVHANPWNDRGRRMFEYTGANLNKTNKMEQAIIELGPYISKIRGVDGFWQGQVPTSTIPRELVLSLLAKVDRKNREDRQRVYTFLVQAEWYTEAKTELDAIARDFPQLRDNVANARVHVVQLEASQLRAEVDVRRKAQQYQDVLNRLRTFPSKDVAAEQLIEVRDVLRREEAQAADDVALADALRATGERLPEDARKAWKKPLLEVLKALKEAPDAVRDRFAAWKKANAEPGQTTAARFALAMSGYVAGSDAAVTELETAAALWKARDLVRDYLRSNDSSTRSNLLEALQGVPLPEDPARKDPTRKLDALTRLALRMPPPLHADVLKPGEPKLVRVGDDDNPAPTEYMVQLPPEYHPLRSYPAVVALHAGGGPKSALAWWAAEASRRGYIVIAPEYNIRGETRNYHYSPSEHAAVELALRDARRRYAIDSDRVFLGGQLSGGDMAWDCGLSHPDLFAGVVVISGDPAKYVLRYLSHTERLPFYVALGDLAPASNEVVFGNILRPMIARGWDVTYNEYYRRGREDFPEEAGPVFDWMDRRRRDPNPKKFEVASARDCDDRFYGVLIREFQDGRTTSPEAADIDGRNLRPATLKMTSSSISNLITLTTNGVNRLDVWVSPKLIDFKRRMEIRVNGRARFKAAPKLEFEPFLEDLRLRGDRQQVYWFKVPVG